MCANQAARKHDTPADTTKAVDELMKALEHPEKDAIEALRAIVLEVDPTIREGVKWNAPSFRTSEYFATTHLRTKRGIGVILHFGAKVREVAAGRESIADPEGLLTWLAKDRATVVFASAGDLATKQKALQAIVRQWIAHV